MLPKIKTASPHQPEPLTDIRPKQTGICTNQIGCSQQSPDTIPLREVICAINILCQPLHKWSITHHICFFLLFFFVSNGDIMVKTRCECLKSEFLYLILPTGVFITTLHGNVSQLLNSGYSTHWRKKISFPTFQHHTQSAKTLFGGNSQSRAAQTDTPPRVAWCIHNIWALCRT